MTSVPTSAPLVDVRQRWVLAVVLASYAMIVIDNSIVITGLPAIQKGLEFSASGLSWVQSAYMLAFGGFMLLGARAGDLLGRKRVFITGLAIFTLSSLFVGLSGTAAWLIATRGLQGVGAAILSPSTLALLSTEFRSGPERHRVLGLYGAIGGITASVGLVVGGITADLLSWRVGFLINVPIGMVLLWGARRYIQETPGQAGQFDIAGAVLSTCGMVALVFGLVHAAEEGWTHQATWVLLALSVILLVAFLRVERHAEQPILPLRLFASRERIGAYVARLLFVGASMGFFFYTTQVLQGMFGLRPLLAGMAFFPSMFVNFLGAMLTPRLTRVFGFMTVLVLMMACSTLGMVWLGQVSMASTVLGGVLLPMLLVGFGMGATLSLLTISGVSGVTPQDAGSASGVVGVAHQIGGALGVSLLVVIYASVSVPPGTAAEQLAAHTGAALTGGAMMFLVSLLVAWWGASGGRRPGANP